MSPRIRYEKWAPGERAVLTIQQANDICAEYIAQGYDLTLRQLYYQFVARGLIPNTDREYKRIGDVINRARMSGLLDWDYIVDRTRNLQSIGHYADPAHIIDVAKDAYALDRWATQSTRIEVWVEKEALAGVVEQVARRHDVSYFSCRGYVSQSEQWAAGRRLRKYIEDGQNVVVLHLGDHDPSGIDMTRDMHDRLRRFIVTDWHQEVLHPARAASIGSSYEAILDEMRFSLGGREPFEIDRIALNWDQVEEYSPPPNPTKMTDSRAEGYVADYGYESWELDALDPATLDALIEAAILARRDDAAWAFVTEQQSEGRALLAEAATRWEQVQDMLENEPGDDDE